MARYRIPVDEARRLYDRLGSWERVAQVLKRPSGQPFKSFSIQAAVRWADMENAGTAYRASMKPDDDDDDDDESANEACRGTGLKN